MAFPVMLTRNDQGRIIGHHSITRLKIYCRWQGEQVNAMKVAKGLKILRQVCGARDPRTGGDFQARVRHLLAIAFIFIG